MKRNILINWGSYDIDNFGDLLFPYLVDFFLSNYNLKVIHASPTGANSRWKDAFPTIKISDAIQYENIVGLVIGGGNLISWTKSSTYPYGNNDTLSLLVHPSFFCIPYILKIKYGIPYAFNFVGVSKPIPFDKKHITKMTIENSSYISCRDKISSNRLKDCGINSNIIVGLDSAFYISAVFQKNKLIEKYHTSVEIKYNIPLRKKLALIYVKKRYFNDEFEELSQIVKLLNSCNIHPIFMPLGMCFKDELILENNIFNSTIINTPENITEILSIIAKAEYYIGSSLHGAIASISYGNKVIIIADEEKSKFSKFSGFLEQINLSNSLFKTWKDVSQLLNQRGITLFQRIKLPDPIELNQRNISIWNDIYSSLTTEKKEKNPSLFNEPCFKDMCSFFKI